MSWPSIWAGREIFAPMPSGDASGVTDRMNLNNAMLAAKNGSGQLLIPKASYILDTAFVGQSGVRTEFEPGTLLKIRDAVSTLATYASGSAVLQVASTATITVGMPISDPSANLQAGDAFGAVPYNAKVTAVDATAGTVTLDKPMAVTGQRVLRFHPRTNCMNLIDVSSSSLVCKGGWAELNGNWQSAYPYGTQFAGGSEDALNNAIRMVNVSDIEVDGIIGAEAFYHGLIGVGRMKDVRVTRWRGRGNGYRSIHFHGEAAGGETFPENRDFSFGRVESIGNGHRAFTFQNQGEFQSGVFVVFENARNYQIDQVLSKDDYGFGLHMSGGAGTWMAAGKGSKFIQVGQLITDNAAIAIQMDSGLESVHIADTIATGKKQTVPSCVFLPAAAITVYYVKSDGTLGTFLGKYVDLPNLAGVGAIAAYGIRPGIRMYAGAGASGMTNFGGLVYAVSAGTGTGGVDQVLLVNYENPASAPYSASGTGDGYFRFARDAMLNMFTDVGRPMRNISFGSINGENMGNYGLKSSAGTSVPRFLNIDFGHVTMTGAAFRNLELGNLNMFNFDSMHVRNAGTGREVGTVNGGFDAALYNCNNGTISNVTGIQDAPFTSNNERIRTDAACRNITIDLVAMPKPVGAPVINVQTPAGAAANASGIAGPVVLRNPMASDGTPLTVAGGGVTRIDATACIITRPVDA